MKHRQPDPNLPQSVLDVLEAALEGVARSGLRAAVERFGAHYAAGDHTDGVVRSDDDALAYAVGRMPSTYAAVRRVLAVAARAEHSFAPESVVDIGAGPGTAILAAACTWGTIARAQMIEPNGYLRHLAGRLVPAVGVAPVVSPADARLLLGEGQANILPGDIVVASYVLVEQTDSDARRIATAAVSRARGMVVFVEPGSKRGFARIRAVRDVIAEAGWHILAPCPHERTCPLPADDWCHFSVRLPRRRMQLELKSARVPFEDEPFSYVVATPRVPSHRHARVLAAPRVAKGEIGLSLCAESGLARGTVARRDKERYRRALRVEAGDTWPSDGG